MNTEVSYTTVVPGFVATEGDLELLANAIVKQLLDDDYLMRIGYSSSVRSDVHGYWSSKLDNVLSFIPEAKQALEEKCRVGCTRNEEAAAKYDPEEEVKQSIHDRLTKNPF
jgi:hypothetical protein